MLLRVLCLMRPTDVARAQQFVSAYQRIPVEICGSSDDVRSVAALVVASNPDIVLYDPSIDLGELLVRWKMEHTNHPALVVVTADPSYAVMAFEAGAVHYLIDVFREVDITSAFDRCVRRIARSSYAHGLSEPHGTMQYRPNVIALPVTSGIEIRSRDQIVRVNGEGNYSTVHFLRDPAITLSKTIGDYESILSSSGFLRVHRSHLVNLMHIRRVHRGKSARVELVTGDVVDVSDRYRDQLFSAVGVVSKRIASGM